MPSSPNIHENYLKQHYTIIHTSSSDILPAEVTMMNIRIHCHIHQYLARAFTCSACQCRMGAGWGVATHEAGLSVGQFITFWWYALKLQHSLVNFVARAVGILKMNLKSYASQCCCSKLDVKILSATVTFKANSQCRI